MKTSKAIVIASLIILVGIVFYSLSNRYYIDSSTKLIVDKFTGEVKSSVIDNTPTQETEIEDFKTFVLKRDIQYSADNFEENMKLLNNNENIRNEFEEYYYQCLENIKKDPLYYSTKTPDATTERFNAYTPLLKPSYIQGAYNKDSDIDTPKEFIEYVRGLYKEYGGDE